MINPKGSYDYRARYYNLRIGAGGRWIRQVRGIEGRVFVLLHQHNSNSFKIH